MIGVDVQLMTSADSLLLDRSWTREHINLPRQQSKFPTISAQYQHTDLTFVIYSQMAPGWLFVSNNSLSQNNCSRSNKYWHHYSSRSRRFTWTVRCSDALNPSRRSRSHVPLPVCSITSYLIILYTALHSPLATFRAGSEKWCQIKLF